MSELIGNLERRLFQDEGYFVAKGMFGNEELNELIDEYYRLRYRQLQEKGKRKDEASSREELYPRLFNQHRVSAIAQKYMLHPKTMHILEQLTEEDMLAFQTVFYFKPPGSKGLQPHQDNYHTGIVPDTCYAAWISLDDADQCNGGLFVFPGSQRLDVLEPEPYENDEYLHAIRIAAPEGGFSLRPVEVARGDVVFFGGQLIHGSYKNNADNRFRHAFVTHYVRTSVQKMSLYHNKLVNKEGKRVRTGYHHIPDRQPWGG